MPGMILINAPLCRERVIRHSNEALLLLPLYKNSKNVLSAKLSRAAHRQPDTLHREGTFKIFNRDAVLNFIPLTWEPQLSFSLAASQSAHGGERYGKKAKPTDQPGHMCVRHRQSHADTLWRISRECFLSLGCQSLNFNPSLNRCSGLSFQQEGLKHWPDGQPLSTPLNHTDRLTGCKLTRRGRRTDPYTHSICAQIAAHEYHQ